jgi:glucosamine kinase
VLAASAADVAASIDVLQGTPPLPVTLIGGLGPAYADHLARQMDGRSGARVCA